MSTKVPSRRGDLSAHGVHVPEFALSDLDEASGKLSFRYPTGRQSSTTAIVFESRAGASASALGRCRERRTRAGSRSFGRHSSLVWF